jgi:hypothetical protein
MFQWIYLWTYDIVIIVYMTNIHDTPGIIGEY